MGVQITDCTIRDGGYLLNKNSKPDFIKGIMKGLVDAGIDYVETGFLQKNIQRNRTSISWHRELPILRHMALRSAHFRKCSGWIADI